jgi:hypothetical protein
MDEASKRAPHHSQQQLKKYQLFGRACFQMVISGMELRNVLLAPGEALLGRVRAQPDSIGVVAKASFLARE